MVNVPQQEFNPEDGTSPIQLHYHPRTPGTESINNPEAGMTLLELSIAAAIMASSLVFILGAVVSLSMTSDVAADQAASMAYVTTVMEELRRAPEDDLLAYVPPEPSADMPEQSVEIKYFLNEDGGVLVPPVDPLSASGDVDELPNPLHVSISISGITKSGRHYTIQSATMVRR